MIDLVEAMLLSPRVGETFTGTIVEINGGHGNGHEGVVMLRDPAIEASVNASAPLPLGREVAVRLVVADASKRVVRFELE